MNCTIDIGNELWTNLVYKDIKPMYEISTYGNIRNRNTKKVLKKSVSEKGYIQIGLMVYSKKKSNKTFKLHVLVAHTFLSKPPNFYSEYYTVNHKNGNKNDNSIYNLEWITFTENIQHSYKLGLNKPRKGSLNGRNKYDEKIIEYVCELMSKNYKNKYIINCVLDKFSIQISKHVIHDIRRKKTWTHISNKYFTKEGSTTIENSNKDEYRYDIIIEFRD